MFEACSCGDWGWGGSKHEVIETFDAIESARGFDPPLFVDARVRRAARAVGFSSDALRELIGDRYRWMKGLGNRAVLEGGSMRLFDPAAVEDLLDRIIEAHDVRRCVSISESPSPRSRPR